MKLCIQILFPNRKEHTGGKGKYEEDFKEISEDLKKKKTSGFSLLALLLSDHTLNIVIGHRVIKKT